MKEAKENQWLDHSALPFLSLVSMRTDHNFSKPIHQEPILNGKLEQSEVVETPP